jgi:tetratricopeptide (TPR) repeat protein
LMWNLSLTTVRKFFLLISLACVVLNAFAQDSATICKNALTSTVSIVTDSVTGSGFFVGDSIIATSYHAIAGATKAYCCRNGSTVKYKIEGYLAVDKEFDLVLLKVSGLNAPVLKMMQTQPAKGQQIFVIDETNGTSEGIISSLLGLNGDTIIEVTANISRKGGGPVINSKGELIGVAVINNSNGLKRSLALPVKYIEQLRKSISLSPVPLSVLNGVANTQWLAARAYFKEGLQRYVLEDYKGSLQDFANAINLNPLDTDAYMFRALAKFIMNDYVGSELDFSMVIGLDPRNKDAYYHRGVIKRKLENYDGAMDDLTKAIMFDEGGVEIYLNRGLAEMKTMNYDDAIKDFTTVVNLDPSYGNSYIVRGLQDNQLQHYRSAIASFTDCLATSPNDFLAYFFRGYAENNSANTYGSNTENRAMTDFSFGFKLTVTNDMNSNFYKGVAKYIMGNYPVALQYFNKAIEVDSRFPDAYYYRARVKNILHDSQGAMEDYASAIRLNPIYGAAYLSRALAEIVAAKDDACKDLKKATKLGEPNAASLLKQNCR